MKIFGILDPVVKQMQIYWLEILYSRQLRFIIQREVFTTKKHGHKPPYMICIKEHVCSEMNFCVPVEKETALRKVSQGQNPVIYQTNVFI